jgi:predicted nucleic acid-binding protein
MILRRPCAKKRISFLADALNINSNLLSTCNKSISLMEKYYHSYWDSLIIPSALESDCSILYTEDMQDGQVIDDRLRIVNPFAVKKY